LLKTTDGTTIFVNATDVPAFADVDADGDLDILTFDSQGSQVRFFENIGGCGSLDFIVNTNCWGQFEEAGQDNGIFLNIACKRNNGSSNRHSGSSLLAFDIDGDNAQELLLGDLNHPNIVYLHNGGDSAFALMDQVNTSFPPGTSPVDIRQFPAAFYMDINQDTKKDLVFAPNAPNISLNSNQVWYYQNTGSSANQSFTLIQKDFLVGEMIDVGTVSNPVFFDYNGDGLLDLVVGNYLFRESVNQESSGLFLFENTGSPTLPEYELVNSNYLDLKSLFNPAIFGLSPTFGDLDNDGDQDMILGDENGNLHYFQNQANQPNALADFILFAPFFASIDVGGSATPQLIDLNQDGLLDLLIGEKSGNLNYYENQGTLEQPFFSTGNNKFGFVDVLPECCTGYSVPFSFENNHGGINLIVGSEAGELFYYSDINQHLNDTFPLSSYQLGEINEGGRISVTGADLNQDNKLDFVFGNRRGGLSLYKSDLYIGINENKEHFSASVNIFPNPSISGTEVQVVITKSHWSNPSFELYSLDGRLLKRMKHNHSSQTSTLSLGKLASGIYLLKFNSHEKMVGSMKVIVL
ncbi:MAG: T9SS type A sorting domain-containing protein, partial [Bacteroidetes bacterium]|nr:T9SS type A sorting domain-containing protein [Bacteroidota bacterium]